MLTATSGFKIHFWIPHAAFLFSLALVSTGCSANEEEPDFSPAESFEQRQLQLPVEMTWTHATASIFILERIVEDKGIEEISIGDEEQPFSDREDEEGNPKVWVTNVDFFEEGGLLVEEDGEYWVDTSVDYWEIGHNIDGGSGDIVSSQIRRTIAEEEVYWCGPTKPASEFASDYLDLHHGKFTRAEQDEAFDHIREYVACEDPDQYHNASPTPTPPAS